MNRRQEGEKTRTTIIRIIGDRPSRVMSAVAFFYVVQRLNQRKDLSVETNVLALNNGRRNGAGLPRIRRGERRLALYATTGKTGCEVGPTRRASCGRSAGRAIHVGGLMVVPSSQ